MLLHGFRLRERHSNGGSTLGQCSIHLLPLLKKNWLFFLSQLFLLSSQSIQAQGMASKCMVSEELERLSGKVNPAGESIIKNVAATMCAPNSPFYEYTLLNPHFRYAAGADTVVSAMSTFFLVMSLYPDVQARGQQEVDIVTGGGQRLPLFTDRSSQVSSNGSAHVL